MAMLIQASRSRALLRGLALTASLALTIAGAASLTQGLAVPVTAQLSQHTLQRQFEEQVAQTSLIVDPAAAATVADPLSKAESGPATKPLAGPRPGPSLVRLGVARLGISEIVRSGEATHARLAGGPIMIKRGDAANPVTILSAHRDTHFAFVRDLQQDDIVMLQSAEGTLDRYRVIRFETVRWDRFSYPLNPARPLLALATCYPFGGTEYGGPWRRVAWAERIG